MPANPPVRFDDGHFFADMTFAGLEIDAADLADKDFQRCIFRQCKLPESRWPQARLEECAFEDCDLSRMVPHGLALHGVTFTSSKLIGIDWSGLGLSSGIAFADCDLRYTSFVKMRLRTMKVVRCVAREASFLDVDLTEADFTDTDLTACTIRNCVLTRTDFSRVTGLFLDPRVNKVKGTRVPLAAAMLFAEALGMVVD